MGIDTRDRIDVRKLTVEAPRVEVTPPPLNLITKSDWPKIFVELEDLKDDYSPNFLYRAYELDVMFPGSVDQLKTDLSAAIDEEIDNFKTAGADNTQIVHVLELVKRMFPQKFETAADEVRIKAFKNAIEKDIEIHDPITPHMQAAAAYRGLFPQEMMRFNRAGLLGEDPWDGSVPDLKRRAARLGSARIIIGEEMLTTPTMRAGDMEVHVRCLEAMKRDHPADWSKIIEHLFYLTVCTAQEIKFTDRGLELVMPGPKEPAVLSVPDIPEVKKF